MNGSMSRQCSQCGEKLPEGAAFCPRDGTRVENAQPFSELEVTVRSSVGSGRGSSARSAAPPSSQPSVPWSSSTSSAPRTGPISTGPRTGPVPEDENQAWEATVARDVLVGKQLDGYVVKRRVGDGGMGIVYEGEHPVIGRKVAIKILRPGLTEGNGARDLIAEARAASAIRHRGIIDIIGFGTLKGIGQYMVMEFLEGTPLNKIISQRAPMPEPEVIALMDELLAALAAAHAVGVIHRDLKPGNVFVERDSTGAETLKVLDFGLAKRSEVPNGTTPQTHASLMVGTPEYMAPEQAVGNAVGPYTDLYAAGLIAYELLTRRLPFEGTTPMALVIQHVQKEPPPPSSFVDMHPEMEALVLRMLAKEPSQRPASADEVRRELRRILQQISQGGHANSLAAPSSVLLAGRDDATVVRPTPRAPTSSPRAPTSAPRSAAFVPVSGLVYETDDTLPEGTQGAVAPEPKKGSRPNHRGLMIGVAAATAVVLAALGGWMMRGVASDSGAQPLAPAPATPVAPVAALAEPPPSPPTPAPVAPPEIKEPRDTSGTPPAPQPGESKESKKAAPKTGVLQLVVRGTGYIKVDGKLMGMVPPLNTLILPAGEHTLEVINQRANPYSAKITIIAGKRVTHRVKLTPKGTSETP
jgi:serine/threonine protein kinase